MIDTSGSMIGEPIAQARNAAIAMLDGLRAGDRITVVTFDTRVQVLVAPTVVGPQTSANIAKQLQQMQARGTTDLAAGLATALQQVATTPLAGSAARIVVLGDGVPNDATTIPQLVAQAAASKIAISALGLGLEYDETLLAQLARGTGGRFHRIAKDETIAAAFRDEVFHIESVIASNLLLQLHPGPGVNIVRVIGHATAPDHTRAHAVRLTDLSAGQQQDIFVEPSEVSAHAEGVAGGAARRDRELRRPTPPTPATSSSAPGRGRGHHRACPRAQPRGRAAAASARAAAPRSTPSRSRAWATSPAPTHCCARPRRPQARSRTPATPPSRTAPTSSRAYARPSRASASATRRRRRGRARGQAARRRHRRRQGADARAPRGDARARPRPDPAACTTTRSRRSSRAEPRTGVTVRARPRTRRC
ncbi:MAG: VWA domain-containing protein [Nannocystaceae bacterium]